MPDFDLRALTLGPAFKPRVEDIKTPDVLTAKGAPDDLLRLVSLSAEHRLALAVAFDADEAKNAALLVCAVVRYRDAGGDDNNGTPVYAMTDAAALAAQDFDLINMWSGIVKPFLGIGQPIAQAVDAEKKDSSTTPSNDGGPALPTASDSTPSETVNPE